MKKKSGACFSGELKEEEIYAEEVGGNVTLETIKCTSEAGTSWIEKHVALVHDLSKFILDLLEAHEKRDSYHNNTMVEFQEIV